MDIDARQLEFLSDRSADPPSNFIFHLKITLKNAIKPAPTPTLPLSTSPLLIPPNFPSIPTPSRLANNPNFQIPTRPNQRRLRVQFHPLYRTLQYPNLQEMAIIT